MAAKVSDPKLVDIFAIIFTLSFIFGFVNIVSLVVNQHCRGPVVGVRTEGEKRFRAYLPDIDFFGWVKPHTNTKYKS